MNTTIPKPNPVVITALLGVSTVVAQALLLREAMAAMGGSEMAWGVVMALWLGGMGVGARVGVRFGSERLAGWLPAVVLVLCGVGIVLFRAAPAILGMTAGETLTTWRGAWLWAAAVLPAALAGGLAFPVLAGMLGDRGPGRAYTVEAAGALLGGLVLSTALLPMGTATALSAVIGAVGGSLLWPRRRLVAIGVAAIFFAAAIPAGELLARRTWRWARHPDVLAAWAETRHQRLEASTGPPVALYADGRFAASYPDPYSTQPRVHLMMLLHPDPKRVLAVGCAIDGSVEAMIRHPVDEIIAVEEDPDLIELLRRWYGENFDRSLAGPSVSTPGTDPLVALDTERNLDLVILAGGDPSTLRANRTRTVEFFQRCRRALNPDGLVVVEVGVADTYLGGTGGRLIAVLCATLSRVYPFVVAIPGEHILLAAGGADADLDFTVPALEERVAARPGLHGIFDPDMLPILVDPMRRPELEEFIRSAWANTNTVDRPRAVLLAASLDEARARPSLVRFGVDLERRDPAKIRWLLVAAAVALVTVAASRRETVRAAAAASVIGLSSMGWWLLLLATWQAARGSVYAEIGALTGVFMAGVAAGGWLGLRSANPVRLLPWLLGAAALESTVLAAGLPGWAPTVAVPVLLVAGGAVTGGSFPGLGRLAGRSSNRRGAGIAYAADEIGAAVAALLIGTVAVPWVGMSATACGLTVLGLAAIPAVLTRTRHE